MLDIQVANDVASGYTESLLSPPTAATPDLEDSNVLNMQSRAADTGASTPVQVPIATRRKSGGRYSGRKRQQSVLCWKIHPSLFRKKNQRSVLSKKPRSLFWKEAPTVSAFQENPARLFRKKTQRLVLSEDKPGRYSGRKPTVSARRRKTS